MSLDAYRIPNEANSIAGHFNFFLYDTEKIDDISACQKIIEENNQWLIAEKLTRAASLIAGLAISYFTFLGAISAFAPAGSLNPGVSSMVLTKVFTITFISAIFVISCLQDVFFLLGKGLEILNEQRSLAEKRLVTLQTA